MFTRRFSHICLNFTVLHTYRFIRFILIYPLSHLIHFIYQTSPIIRTHIHIISAYLTSTLQSLPSPNKSICFRAHYPYEKTYKKPDKFQKSCQLLPHSKTGLYFPADLLLLHRISLWLPVGSPDLPYKRGSLS